MYPPDLVAPMAKDLTDFGFESLNTAEDVIDAIENTDGSLMLVVNSVCGCAAANARPGAKLALKNEHIPDRLVTVFAGVDREATGKAREYLLPYPPSSPSIAVFKNGKLVTLIERHQIEGRSAYQIADDLRNSFDEHCA